MPSTIGLSTVSDVQVISAYAATNQQIDAVTPGPGWFIIGAFQLPAAVPEARLEAIGSVSLDGNLLNVRLFDVTAFEPVNGAAVQITALLDERKASGFFPLLAGRVYQMQAEVIGPSGFGSVKNATLI